MFLLYRFGLILWVPGRPLIHLLLPPARVSSLRRYPLGLGLWVEDFFLAFGKVVIHGVERVTIIPRRLAYIQSICPLSDDPPLHDVHRIYDELLKLLRCDAFLH